jgi:transcriptional/translational regulatory protein YebC/TACO1
MGHNQAQEGRHLTPNAARSFTRVIKEIMIAARSGGDPDG